jgi:Rieske Fe-S protein
VGDDTAGPPAGNGDVQLPAESDVAAEPDGITRRKLLARSVGVMSAAITAGIGVPAVFYVAGPSGEQQETQEWIRLGSASSVEPGEPTLMKATIERRSGYLTNVEELSVFVTTDNGVDFVALSNVCTHLGCRVRWVQDQDGFFCPCHNAVFNPDGSVGTGPPPRPLDQFETKVEDGQIYIRGV